VYFCILQLAPQTRCRDPSPPTPLPSRSGELPRHRIAAAPGHWPASPSNLAPSPWICGPPLTILDRATALLPSSTEAPPLAILDGVAAPLAIDRAAAQTCLTCSSEPLAPFQIGCWWWQFWHLQTQKSVE
jgi:hypothetical protein